MADLSALAQRAEQFEEDSPTRRRVGRREIVEVLYERQRPLALPCQHGVLGEVRVTRKHPLALSPCVAGQFVLSHR